MFRSSNVGVLPILPVETQRPREVLRLALAGAIGIPGDSCPAAIALLRAWHWRLGRALELSDLKGWKVVWSLLQPPSSYIPKSRCGASEVLPHSHLSEGRGSWSLKGSVLVLPTVLAGPFSLCMSKLGSHLVIDPATTPSWAASVRGGPSVGRSPTPNGNRTPPLRDSWTWLSSLEATKCDTPPQRPAAEQSHILQLRRSEGSWEPTFKSWSIWRMLSHFAIVRVSKGWCEIGESLFFQSALL